jgi:predicted acetyltransferase
VGLSPAARVSIRVATVDDFIRLAPLMEAYVAELGPLAGGAPPPPASAHFEIYWQELGRHAFVLEIAAETVGFALLRSPEPGVWSVGEFFVDQEHRHMGIGEAAAAQLFDRFSGEWRVTELEANVAAQRFWRAVIGRYTRGAFIESWSSARPRGPMQIFRR